ncbi:MAG: cytochrome c [Alphaproteobacteria bacterium]|nr:cytochrome c [Alphaproteobacteria bacterium]
MKANTILLAAALSLAATGAMAQANCNQFPQQGGEALYNGICQDCHMPDGRGAEGAGHYPALARNPKLAEPGYPISVVTQGLKSMPAFGGAMSDQQIADVVNYVRTHFGNAYKDTVKPEDVKNAR